MNQSPQRRRGRGRCGHPVNVNNSDAINRAGRSNTNNRTTGRSSSNNTPRSTTAQEGANTKKNDKNHEYTKSTTTSTSNLLSSSSVSKKTKTKKKRTTKTTTKRFRKMKVLRMWVLPTLFLIPLFIIVIEYYIGKIISLEDIQDVYVEQMYDPWELLLMDIDKMSDTTTTTTEDSYPDNNNINNNNNHNNADATAVVSSRSNSFNIVGSLPNISYTVRSKCPQGFRRMINVHNPMSHSNYGKTQQQKRDHSIPMIVHQQSKTRCLTMNVDRYVSYVFFLNHMIYEITIVTKFSGCGM